MFTKDELLKYKTDEFWGRPFLNLSLEEQSVASLRDLYKEQAEFATKQAVAFIKMQQGRMNTNDVNIIKDAATAWKDRKRVAQFMRAEGVALEHIPYAVQLVQAYFLRVIKRVKEAQGQKFEKRHEN